MFKLKDKVVVITGGTRGIGYATAKAFLEQGAKVIIMGSRTETVDKALKNLEAELEAIEDRAEQDVTNSGHDLGDSVSNAVQNTSAKSTKNTVPPFLGFHPNLTSFEEVKNTFAEIHKTYGRIDVLINNAGISADKKIEETTSEDFAKIMDLNVDALFNTCKAVTLYMKEQGGGVILNTSSMVSIYGQPSGVGYPTSKFAVNGLTRSLARELAPYNIRVNAVAPGIIDTDMISVLPEDVLKPLIKTIPLGRIGQPRDIANAFMFLASDLASYITGVILQVDGAARN